MKKATVILIVFLGVLLMGSTGSAKPVITIDKPTYTFDPVIDGTKVTHTFVIKNTGDTLLNIHSVEPP